MSQEKLVTRTITRVDRGQRPAARGVFHMIAAVLAVIAGAVLITFTWMQHSWPAAVAVTVYSVGVVALFGTSAAYHRGPWQTQRAVDAWGNADHAMIALFIAATYTPIAVMTLSTPWLLIGIWIAAIASIGLNFVAHPRVLDVMTFLVLGWAVVPMIPSILEVAGATVVWLLAAGGVVYSVGALFYATKWPGRNASVIGYHEYFHAATIIAAILHMIGIWILVVD